MLDLFFQLACHGINPADEGAALRALERHIELFVEFLAGEEFERDALLLVGQE